MPKRRPAEAAARQEAHRPTIVGAVAGEERRREYGERIGRDYRWLPYDSLELLPHLLEGVDVSGVVVDLVRWTPVEAAPVLRELRERWPALRIVGLYEPSAESLPDLARLAHAERRLAFAADPDARLELLLRRAPEATAAAAPSAAQLLLEQLLPLADDAGVRGTLIHLALAPSHRLSVPALAAVHGWSEDALERHFAAGGLASPAVIRRLVVAAEGLWQVAARRCGAEDAAQALGLGAGDSLGRMINGIFGVGFTAARLMGAAGARHLLRWVGLLGLRDLARFGGLPAVAGMHFRPVNRRALELEDRGSLVRALVNDGLSLGAVVDRLADEPEAAKRLAGETIPFIRRLLQRRLIVPVAPAREVL